MKTAIVYDRVNKWGGAERVLLTLHDMFPDAPLYTSVYNPETASWAKVFPMIYTSFLQNIPYAKNNHESLAPFMPLAFESFNFDSYDLVISVTSEAAKGIITKPGTLHICYCLTPTRYLWSHYTDYFQGPTLQAVTRPIVSYLKGWDRIAAQRPDVMIGISTEVQKRIKKYYQRDSELIFPPVDIEKFFAKPQLDESFQPRTGKRYFLLVSRLVAYKKVDFAIKTFNKLGYPLIIVGTGSEKSKLKPMSKKNILFKGSVSDNELIELYKSAEALIFPGEEDFGLVMVEAISKGTPVIAYNKGGALDIVKDGVSGFFFDAQTVENLANTVIRFQSSPKFNREVLIKSVAKFSKEHFQKGILDLINKSLNYNIIK